MKTSPKDNMKKILMALPILVVLIYFNNHVFASSEVKSIGTLIDLQQQESIKWTKIIFQQNGNVYHSQSEADIQRMKEKIEREFQVTMTFSNEEAGPRYEGTRKISSNAALRVALIGQKEEDSDHTFHTYFMAEVSTESLDNWQDHYQKFESQLAAFGVSPQINTSVNGKVNQIMSQKQLNAFVQDIISDLNGEVKEGLTDDTVISVSGYSPQLDREIETTKGKINFQTMAYVDEQKMETLVTVGTPIITTDH